MEHRSTVDRFSAPFARGFLVVEGLLQVAVGTIVAAFAWNLRSNPPCPSYSDCQFDATNALPLLMGFAAIMVVLGLATVIGAATIRRRHRPAWWLAVGSQCAAVVSIIVPVAGSPFQIGWAVLAVIPLVGLGLLFTRELRPRSASV